MQNSKSYRGRIRQVPIYLGKCFRAFIFMDDWKVIPMAAIIGGLVSFVACRNMFKYMETTVSGGLAMVFVCIWNGFFNSIQVICRERDVIKREHRSGMHITSYIAAHMVYQAFICMLQVTVLIFISGVSGIEFPLTGVITRSFIIDYWITLFLITYSADMLSLMISAIAPNPTAAMTVMPFVLIIQLVCSGVMFQLAGGTEIITKFTVSRWGMEALCSIGNYNSLPMMGLWNQLFKFRSFELIEGIRPVEEITNYMMDNNLTEEFMLQSGQYSQNVNYLSTPLHVLNCWGVLILMAVVTASVAVIFLKNIDRDKR